MFVLLLIVFYAIVSYAVFPLSSFCAIDFGVINQHDRRRVPMLLPRIHGSSGAGAPQ